MCPSPLTSAASFQRRPSGVLGMALATAATSLAVTLPSPSTSIGHPSGAGVKIGSAVGDGRGVGAGAGDGEGVGAGVGDGEGVGAGVGEAVGAGVGGGGV